MEPQGVLWVIFLVVVTELNDILQYLTGKAFGKRKILPKISPNKTIAGFLGGLLLSPILSMAIGSLLDLPISLLSLGLIGFFLSFCGFWGDVTFSYLKRRAGVKDTSTLIPGHGGLLDRIDSLLFNCIWFYLWILR
jgi:cytidylyltransferase family